MPRRRPTAAVIKANFEYLSAGTSFGPGVSASSKEVIAVFLNDEDTVTEVFVIGPVSSPAEAMTRAWTAFCDLLSDCSGSDGRTIPLSSAPTDQFRCEILPSSALRSA